MAQAAKNLPAMQETQVQSQGWGDPLEKGMATHSSILAWRIPWTEEPGELLRESMGSQRAGHWVTNPFTLLLFFPIWSFQLFYYFLFIWIASLNCSLRVHLATHSFSFSYLWEYLYFPFVSEGSFISMNMGFIVGMNFSALEKYCFLSCYFPCFQMWNLFFDLVFFGGGSSVSFLSFFKNFFLCLQVCRSLIMRYLGANFLFLEFSSLTSICFFKKNSSSWLMFLSFSLVSREFVNDGWSIFTMTAL